MSSNMFTISQLKELIKLKNRTIDSVASDMRVSRQYLSRLLNGDTEDISLKQLRKICSVLELTVNLFITD